MQITSDGANGEVMRITAAGNVGIGTTAPTAKLSVNGSANKTGRGSWAVFSDRRLKLDQEVEQLKKENQELRDEILNIKQVLEHLNRE